MKWPPSLRQLLVALVAVAVLPSFVVAVLAWWSERATLLNSAEEQVSTVAMLVALNEQRRFDGVQQLLAAAAASPVVRRMDMPACSQFMSSLQSSFPGYSNVGSTDLQGRVVCTAVPSQNSVIVNDRAYFREALKTRRIAAEYVVGRFTGVPSLTFAQPLMDGNGAVRGVVFAALDLERAGERLRSLDLPDYLEVFISTQDGTVLTSSQPGPGTVGRLVPYDDLRAQVADAASAATGVKQARKPSFSLVRRIGDYRPTRIIVAVRARADSLLTPATKRLHLQLIVLTLAMFCGAALAWLVGQRGVVAPASRLLARMGRLEHAQPSDQAGPHPMSRELSDLDKAFSRMQEQLQIREHERERLLGELQQAQGNVLTAQRISRVGYWELDVATGRIGTTETMAEILGRPAPTSLDQLLALIPETDRGRLDAALTLTLRTGVRLDLENRLAGGGGRQLWVRTIGEPERAPNGALRRVRGSMQDISERKAADDRFAAQLSRLQLLHQITRAITDRVDLPGILAIVTDRLEQQMPLDFCLMASYDAPGHCLVVSHIGTASQATAQQLGLARGVQLPSNVNGLSRAVQGELVHEPDTSGLPWELPQRLAKLGLHSLALAPLHTQSGVFGIILAARRQPSSLSSTDCEFLLQLSQQVALAIRQTQLYGALQRAFDDLQHSQQVALQHERLRALGQMASGIAHDINNGLSPLTLYLDSLLQRERGLSQAGRTKLEMMRLAVAHVAQSVDRVRDFYRPTNVAAARTLVRLNRAVRQVIELTRVRWRNIAQRSGAAIEVVTDLQEPLPEIVANEAEVRDALTNLVFNAVDAMPDGGRLTFRTCTAGEGTGEQAVEVSVGDTGVGMDEETRHRCIEPFFTTKGERGSGLGLASVCETMRRYRGRLDIESSPGRGTTVRLRFPLAGTDLLLPEVPTGLSPPPVPPMRLLVVDDDPSVLQPLAEALRSDGHEVATAQGGREAIVLFGAALHQGHAFDAVVTDLGMPQGDGSLLAREVKAQRPATRVIMLTGWGRQMAEDDDPVPDVDCLLSKPPHMDQLREALVAPSKQPDAPRHGGETR